MQFKTSLSCLLFSWSFIATGVEFVAPVLKERPVVEPEETLNILINHDTIMMIITLFCAAVFIMVMYGRWLKVKLAFQATTKQSFIDSIENIEFV